jgi:hypothetical protein
MAQDSLSNLPFPIALLGPILYYPYRAIKSEVHNELKSMVNLQKTLCEWHHTLNAIAVEQAVAQIDFSNLFLTPRFIQRMMNVNMFVHYIQSLPTGTSQERKRVADAWKEVQSALEDEAHYWQ